MRPASCGLTITSVPVTIPVNGISLPRWRRREVGHQRNDEQRAHENKKFGDFHGNPAPGRNSPCSRKSWTARRLRATSRGRKESCPRMRLSTGAAEK